EPGITCNRISRIVTAEGVGSALEIDELHDLVSVRIKSQVEISNSRNFAGAVESVYVRRTLKRIGIRRNDNAQPPRICVDNLSGRYGHVGNVGKVRCRGD